MAKKDFMNNPAMSFLSAENEEEKSEAGEGKQKKNPEPKKTELKKISLELPEKRETKSKQIHLLIKPSNYEKLKKISKQNGRSVNDFLNCLIEQL